MQLSQLIKKYEKLGSMLTEIPSEIRDRFIVRKFPRDTVICKKDEVIRHVYIICAGTMRIVNEFDNGNIYAFTDTEPYTWIGDTELLAGVHRYDCTVESVTDCTTLQMSREDFLTCFESSHVFAKELARTIANKVHHRSSKIGENIFYPVLYNMASLLIQLAQENAVDNKAAIILLKRQHMAERLGISIRSVNRAIKRLRENHYLSIAKGKIVIEPEQLLRLMQAVDQFK
ncbi:Crp/Fnr family transcriptional regulator [Brevibacillus sp. BC25]|uniref:Crp/Fnr family transcriptional regulator n=1 Tax=Brevibacillus sp. BC25 TaxID=1144308 RepID=UPI000270E613|nr:Crp/Fnr family transcriptional regulator [Brevibacillus sp. BC25]EJL24197.1 cAMP-binding protein [Brevibacillus sp. BC25]